MRVTFGQHHLRAEELRETREAAQTVRRKTYVLTA
jgi:hypothetical protein